jgi:hypothetical protein
VIGGIEISGGRAAPSRQYSSGSRMQVEDRSASVITQIRAPSESA